MGVKWTPDLTVGVDMIDGQHKIWFDKADQLFEAGKNGKAKEVISELLQFLDSYTKEHIADEEKYMQSINYPEYQIQKNLHTNFIAELSKLRQEFDASGSNISIIVNANQMIVDWLTKHISKEDKKIGEFAKTL